MKILGHRGAIMDRASFYQNSFWAFEEAVDAADGFETDACADKDGEVFFMHESRDIGSGSAFEHVVYDAAHHLDAGSAAFIGNRRIDEMTTEEMKRLRLKDGSPVPTLKQAIRLVGSRPGKIINIELKAYDVARHVLKVIKRSLDEGSITLEAVIVSSFNHAALEEVRRETPQLKIGAIFNYSDAPPRPMFPWQPQSTVEYMPLTKATINTDVLGRVKPDYFVMPEEILTEDNVAMIGAVHPQALCVGWVFTEKGHFDLPGFLKRLGALRATGKLGAMIIDNPREFVQTLRG